MDSLRRVPSDGAAAPSPCGGVTPARPGHPRLGRGAHIISYDDAVQYLLALTHRRPYFQFSRDERRGWRSAIAALRDRREELLGELRDLGVRIP